MITREGITRILDAAYAEIADEQAWLEGIHAAANGAFEGSVATVAQTTRVTTDDRARISSSAGYGQFKDLVHQSHDTGATSDVRRAYRAGPVLRSSALLRQTDDPLIHASVVGVHKAVGGADTVAAIGADPSGCVCSLGFVMREARLPRGTHTTLSRLAGHLGAAYRLRNGVTTIDAVMSPEGKVLDGDGALIDDVGDSLRRAALSVDRSRRHAKTEPDEGLGYWKAMVEGRWTLVERFESDGRRILVARANAPQTRKQHALTENECKVVSLVALCHPSKLVAYELGFAESTVSELLKSAFKKLGLRSKAELVELYGAFGANR